MEVRKIDIESLKVKLREGSLLSVYASPFRDRTKPLFSFAYPRDVLPDDPLAPQPRVRNSISPSHFAKGVFDSQHSLVFK